MLTLVDLTGQSFWTMLLLVLLITLVYIYSRTWCGLWKQLGYPEGPRCLPFLGSMLDLFDSKKGTIACVAEWQRKYGRVIPCFWFWDPMLVITDPEIIREITVKNFNTWSDRYLLGHGDLQQRILRKGLFFATDADWKRVRRIMTPTFSGNKLKLLTHYMNLTSHRLAEKISICALEAQPAYAKNMFGAFALDVLCGTAFGLDINSQNDSTESFLKHAQSLMSFDKYVQMRLTVAGLFPFMTKVFKMLNMGFFLYRDIGFFKESIMAIIHERKLSMASQKYADFLQLLIKAEASDSDDIIGDKKLTTEEIAAQGIIFIIAGYETTSSTLQFLFYELSKNPNVQDRLVFEIESVLKEDEEPDYDACKRLKYMEAVINETLRIYPPIHLLTRRAVVDTTLAGRPVPAGTAVLFPTANIGRDPEFFPDPDIFKPERFFDEPRKTIDPVTFLPFGYGPRQCIGLRLAMMEIKIALVHILRKVRVIGGTPKTLELEDFTGVLVPKVPVQLHLQAVNRT